MLFTNTYKKILSESNFQSKSKVSEFLAFTFKVINEQIIKGYLTQLKHDYSDATQHCYAYILHIDKNASRANDDCEPSNTAGKPILRQIQSLDLTNVLVVVIRYFVSPMLGVPGLIEAYGEATLGCLKVSGIIEKNTEECYQFSCDYGFENEIYRIGKQFDLDIKPMDNEEHFCAEIKIPLLLSASFKK